MRSTARQLLGVTLLGLVAAVIGLGRRADGVAISHVGAVTSRAAAAFDRSPSLTEMRLKVGALDRPECDGGNGGCGISPKEGEEGEGALDAPMPSHLAAGRSVEQRAQGTRPPAAILASFDGLGFGFSGPQGTRRFNNPSDNSLAVGRDQIVQIVNGGMAVFTKQGRQYDTTGRVLYGPVSANAIFTGFGGPCEARNSGDAVVRYDQLADRWLYVLPIFQRDTTAAEEFQSPSRPGQAGQPGPPGPSGLIDRPAPAAVQAGAPQGGGGGRGAQGPRAVGPYAMCYAVSVGEDPLGPYYRYQFVRSLFPDYPRPAIWPDGYYVPSSTGDNVIQKHACVADRAKMLRGLPATEQCVVVDGVNFLNNADIDGHALPPLGAPNIVMAAGGAQLLGHLEDDGIYAWKFHVDWVDPSRTGLSGPVKIPVAPYHYLCDGQLTRCVPQPGDSTRLDAQGDKLMQRLVYRNIGGHQSILALHSINTSAGGGGVRWYEFRLDGHGDPALFQQGTYAPDSLYRWMGSIGMDRKGNIGVGYSFGGLPHYPGQRFAGRLAGDPPGLLTLHETVLVEGEAAQARANRWEDYTTTAMDPVDDCTFWYVGDYIRAGQTSYSSRIGGFRLPGCLKRH